MTLTSTALPMIALFIVVALAVAGIVVPVLRNAMSSESRGIRSGRDTVVEGQDGVAPAPEERLPGVSAIVPTRLCDGRREVLLWGAGNAAVGLLMGVVQHGEDGLAAAKRTLAEMDLEADGWQLVVKGLPPYGGDRGSPVWLYTAVARGSVAARESGGRWVPLDDVSVEMLVGGIRGRATAYALTALDRRLRD